MTLLDDIQEQKSSVSGAYNYINSHADPEIRLGRDNSAWTV